MNTPTPLADAFYGWRHRDVTSESARRTRNRCQHGVTGTCYLAQKLDLITGSILSLPTESKIKYFGSAKPEKILNSYLFIYFHQQIRTI